MYRPTHWRRRASGRPRAPLGPIAVVLAWAVALGGCAGSGELRYADGRHAKVTPDGLHQIDTWGGRAERVYVRPGVDLAKYDKVMLDPVVVRFSMSSPRTLSQSEVSTVRKDFREIFLKELGKSRVYALVTTPGPSVLRVTPKLVDVVVTQPPRAATPDEIHVMESSGAVTLSLELSDSRSHAVLVRAFDRRPVGAQSGLAYRDTAGADMARARLVFVRWAQRLRGWLDRVRAIPPLPVEATGQTS